jgi:hypothetical protein
MIPIVGVAVGFPNVSLVVSSGRVVVSQNPKRAEPKSANLLVNKPSIQNLGRGMGLSVKAVPVTPGTQRSLAQGTMNED